MTSKAELQRQVEDLKWKIELSNGSEDMWRKTAIERGTSANELAAFKRENEELAHSVNHLGEHVHTLQHLLEDILTLEPQLKHYLTDGDWDVERIGRAAEHLLGEEALASLGYTDACVYPENVTPLFPSTPGRGAA